MDRRRLLSLIRKTWISVGIAATVVFVSWSLVAYRASPDARIAGAGDAAVASQRKNGVWRFTPSHATAGSAGLLFFPGALVDPAAYAPLARAVAAAGHPVVIIELPRRGALGGADDPRVLERAHAQLAPSDSARPWVVAGHSRGAVVASALAAQGVRGVAGLLLAGTTHPRDVDLSALRIPVTKLVGTNDGIAPEAVSDANRRLLPPGTRWIRIEGGNHSQFGWYGFQPGDHRAGISAERQHALFIAAVLDLLREAGA